MTERAPGPRTNEEAEADPEQMVPLRSEVRLEARSTGLRLSGATKIRARAEAIP